MQLGRAAYQKFIFSKLKQETEMKECAFLKIHENTQLYSWNYLRWTLSVKHSWTKFPYEQTLTTTQFQKQSCKMILNTVVLPVVRFQFTELISENL